MIICLFCFQSHLPTDKNCPHRIKEQNILDYAIDSNLAVSEVKQSLTKKKKDEKKKDLIKNFRFSNFPNLVEDIESDFNNYSSNSQETDENTQNVASSSSGPQGKTYANIINNKNKLKNNSKPASKKKSPDCDFDFESYIAQQQSLLSQKESTNSFSTKPRLSLSERLNRIKNTNPNNNATLENFNQENLDSLFVESEKVCENMQKYDDSVALSIICKMIQTLSTENYNQLIKNLINI